MTYSVFKYVYIFLTISVPKFRRHLSSAIFKQTITGKEVYM